MPTTSTTAPPPPTVAALGDSQLFESLDDLRARVPGLSIEDHAVIGLKTAEGHFGLTTLLSGDPDALLVVLGTNDALDGAFTTDEREALADLAGRVAKAPCTRWLDVPTSTPSEVFNAAARDYNAALLRQALEHGFQVVQWSFELAGHPEWFRPDGIHLSDAGQEALAAALATSLDTCLSLAGGALLGAPGTTTTTPGSPVPAPG